MLAAKVFNREMNGPRRIDGEGMWPAVSAAAAETVQERVALPAVGVAFRAPVGHNNLALAAVQQAVFEGPAEPWPFQWTDPHRGAPRPHRLAMGWRVYQMEIGRSRAWVHLPSMERAEKGPDLSHYERRSCLGTVLEVEHIEKFTSVKVLLQRPRNDELDGPIWISRTHLQSSSPAARRTIQLTPTV